VGQLTHRHCGTRGAGFVIEKAAVDLIVAFKVFHVHQESGDIDEVGELRPRTLEDGLDVFDNGFRL
jgi:hypothetical protein